MSPLTLPPWWLRMLRMKRTACKASIPLLPTAAKVGANLLCKSSSEITLSSTSTMHRHTVPAKSHLPLASPPPRP